MKVGTPLRCMTVTALLSLLAVPPSFGWGNVGHSMINKLAAESLPADMPAFLHEQAAIDEIEYLGPEPDRWRGLSEPELNAVQAPDHFMDLELADVIQPLPHRRYEFIAAAYAAGLTHPAQARDLQPERIGFQPYITNEVWERLRSAMRDYRDLSAKHQDTKPVEAAILFYAGWLGHYVGDGSQPLHTTVNYNGWVSKDNPNGYTTDHKIHWQFEGVYVAANIKESDVKPLIASVHPVSDEFNEYMTYLRHSSTLVEHVYQLEKTHGFEGAGTPEAKAFTVERLAAGASMLRDLIYSAWLQSAEPVPQQHYE